MYVHVYINVYVFLEYLWGQVLRISASLKELLFFLFSIASSCIRLYGHYLAYNMIVACFNHEQMQTARRMRRKLQNKYIGKDRAVFFSYRRVRNRHRKGEGTHCTLILIKVLERIGWQRNREILTL